MAGKGATLSTHVLDVGTGRPASGVTVSVTRDDRVIATARTDGDGRVRELARDLESGPYRVVFELATPFFKRVALDIEVGDGHHHVPLLVSPFGVSAYRGS